MSDGTVVRAGTSRVVEQPVYRQTLFVITSHSAAFRRNLKTHAFSLLLPPSSDPAAKTPRFLSDVGAI